MYLFNYKGNKIGICVEEYGNHTWLQVEVNDKIYRVLTKQVSEQEIINKLKYDMVSIPEVAKILNEEID